MPLLGYDLVVQCKACTEIARARFHLDKPGSMDAFVIWIQLLEQGFEPDGGDDWLCWNHGTRRQEGEPAPVLHKERA